MSEPKLISPMLDEFVMGEPFSEHNGVRSCPAMDQRDGSKYIVKIISVPASPKQLDAMLLSGAFQDKAGAVAYFEEIANGLAQEAEVLKKLAGLEGFMAFEGHQICAHDEEDGFDVYLLGTYKHSLARLLRKDTMTHLSAVNLGLDMCAALSVCRRSGYLYVNLKPDNIFVTADNGYRIGDLGFMRLDSLKYASLPDRYRSAYTAPEIDDAFASLNTTVDIYALGLVLYQVFNGGVLPTVRAGELLPPPDYADYEMAEIILKACAPDPADRWTDPVEMGQALVTYMQRNGVHDTPIVPAASEVFAGDSAAPVVSADATESDAAEITADEDDRTDVPEPAEASAQEDDAPFTIGEMETGGGEEASGETAYAEDDFGNLTFITTEGEDETLPGTDAEDLDYEQVSVEVSDILSQADALLAHPTPDPVVTPEPIDVPIPEPLTEGSTEPEEDAKQSETEETTTDGEQLTYDPETAGIDDAEEPEFIEEAPKKKHRWIPIVIIAAVVVALLAGAFYYYRNVYLQMIDSIVFDGDKTQLTVQVHTEIDETLLSVVCSDAYGNQLQAPVENGKAVFNDLSPDSAYTVKVLIKGFHRLTGDTSGAYTTPVQTSISNFTAQTGPSDGSVVLNFDIDGPDAAQWKVTYSTAGEEAREIIFTDHTIEIPGLTVGSVYEFELSPTENLFFTGENKVSHTASKLVVAENLTVTELNSGKLTAVWSAPADTSVANWTVRCYNGTGYTQEITTQETTATFTGLTQTDAFTVEVTAEGMSQSQHVEIPANSVSVLDFKNTSTTSDEAVLTWNVTDSTKDKKLVLHYSADGSSVKEIKDLTGNTAKISPLVPGATYTFTLKTDDGSIVVGGTMTHKVAEAADFDAYGIMKKHIKLTMCRTPSKANWKHGSVPKSDYTTTFTVGQKASFIIYLDDDKYSTSTDSVTTLYVIRDAEGKIVSTATQTATWKSMWYQHYGEFDVPALPGTAGEYTITIYFNGALAGAQDFTMTA